MGKKNKKIPISGMFGVKKGVLYTYHQPLHSILKERDKSSQELVGYLKELGYE